MSAAWDGDLEKLKRLNQAGYDFNVTCVSTTHIMLNYTMTSLIIQLLKLLH